MKAAEFEEKEYEGVLYSQLCNARSNVWPPGQVLEQHLGFDMAMFLQSPRVWRMLARTMPAGACLNRYNWHPIWMHRPVRPLPNFRLNLFIQAKRPSVFTRAPRLVKAVGITAPVWAFDVREHQQEALERVAGRIGPRGAIVYAAPAFHSAYELFAHTRAGSVIQNSTFPDALRLRGHHRWYYNQPGGAGVANPEPEYYSNGPSLDDTIEKLRVGAGGSSEATADQNLAELAEVVSGALRDRALNRNPLVAIFQEELRAIDRELASFEVAGRQIRSFYTTALFSERFNVEWFTLV